MCPKRHDDLFPGIASFPALRAAARKAIKGKRTKPMPAAFMAGLEKEILKLERELQAGTYRPGGYVCGPHRGPEAVDDLGRAFP